jgi:acyl-CoA synthetase (AMP-forming)/AMP-acid ligase II
MQFAIARFGAVTELRTGRSWRSSELAEAVRTRASVMESLGVKGGDRVLLAEAGSGSFFADLFAVWHVGASVVCLSPRIATPELQTIAGFVQPSLLIVGEAQAAPDVSVPTICLARERLRAPKDTARPPACLDDEALILFTSGTTGTPKGVVHTFRSLIARVALNSAVVGAEALRKTLCLLPVHFGHGLIGNSLTPLMEGHDLVIADEAGPTVLGSLDAILDEHEITFLSSVPAIWRMALRFCRREPRRALVRAHVGSAPLSAGLWQSIVDWCRTADVVNAYGLTETANWAAGASAQRYAPADGLVGRMWGGAAAIRNLDGTLAASGEGEIVLQTPALMRGYFRRPELDADTWCDGWLRTRDYGCIDGDGTICLLGRLGQEINRGGTKVQPQDVEQLLERSDQVVEACAFPVPDDILGESVGVAVVLTDGTADALARLQAWSGARLSRDKLPDHWFVVDAIPRTDRGKTDRAAVRALCLARCAEAAADA